MFEVTGGDISLLNDDDFRTLATRLSLAKLSRLSLPLSGVTAGGDQNAADGGLDVRVSRPVGSLNGDFIPRDETGIQVKLPDMPRSAIISEMRPNGALRPVIAELAEQGGAYVIISAKGSVSDSSLKSRRAAMREAVADHTNAAALHTDFYDRDRLANWLREYPGISAWVLERAGRAIKGWQSLANWSEGGASSQPYLIDDSGCITDERSREQENLPILEGISRIRQSLVQPGKCVRLIGLSGLGKTRLVEALFDGEVGSDPLPAALAVYTDNADEPDPSARDMARRFVESGQRVILIVDNCNPATHAALSQNCSANGSSVSLITVEYDVRDDEPEGTDVFRLGTASEGIIDQWLERTCPHVSQVDRRRIAAFSDGNFRVAKALAHTINKGETLGTLNDRSLFERIFHQRNAPDHSLMNAAEICSLVYSFDGEDTSQSSELAALAALAGQTVEQLYGHISELKQRGVLQTRSKWRAILPHAIANRLAGLALDRITPERFDQFSALLSPRLLKSLSRRLGYPTHRPYPKQAIRTLLMSVDKSCDEATVNLLEKTRNSLMHGATLKEIESSLPDPHESVVDTLGKFLWRALVHQFPREMFDGSLVMGQPSTYIDYKTTAVGHIQTIVPIDADGNFDLSFSGMVMEMKPFGPPQSALPYAVRMTTEQFDQLKKLSHKKGDQQEMLERIRQCVRERNGEIYSLIISTDMKLIRSAIQRGELGDLQDLFRQFVDTAKVVH